MIWSELSPLKGMIDPVIQYNTGISGDINDNEMANTDTKKLRNLKHDIWDGFSNFWTCFVFVTWVLHHNNLNSSSSFGHITWWWDILYLHFVIRKTSILISMKLLLRSWLNLMCFQIITWHPNYGNLKWWLSRLRSPYWAYIFWHADRVTALSYMRLKRLGVSGESSLKKATGQ